MAKIKPVDALILAASLIFLLGMIPPSFDRSREVVRRAKCASNLKQIMAAIHEYAVDFDGWYPTDAQLGQSIPTFSHYETLGILYPSYVPSLDVFTCPSSGDRMPRRNDPDGVYDSRPFRYAESKQASYAYGYDGTGGRNVAWKETTRPTTRIVADRHALKDLTPESNHGAEGRNMALSDGSVIWISEPSPPPTDPDNPNPDLRTRPWWSERP